MPSTSRSSSSQGLQTLSSLPHRLKCTSTSDSVNALHLAPSFFHRTSTEMALFTKNITHTGSLSPLHYTLDIRNPGGTGSTAFPAGPARAAWLVASSAAADVPADAHIVVRGDLPELRALSPSPHGPSALSEL